MKRAVQAVFLALLLCGSGCQQQNQELDAELAAFTKAKETQAQQFVSDGNLQMPPEGWKLFSAIRADNFTAAARSFSQLEARHSAGPNPLERAKTAVIEKFGCPTSLNAVESPAWHALLDAYWAYALSRQWSNEFLRLAINDIVATVPTNAILFAGSDVTRFSISAWAETRTNGRPFYVISQTQLADWNYSAYVTNTYGTTIRLPGANVFTTVFQNALSNSAGASPAMIVKRMNSALTRYIYVQNSANDVYVHPYWIFDWMYLHLVPEGPLLKMSRTPLKNLPPDSIKTNRQYWSGLCEKLIGDWITESTTPMEVCDFAEKVFLRRDLRNFKGNFDYLNDTRAQEQFAAFRFATADLYLWRCAETTSVVEKQSMLNESLLAFVQSFALGPNNSRVAYYFADVLAQMTRYDEALRILKIGISLQPADPDLKTKREEIELKVKSASSN